MEEEWSIFHKKQSKQSEAAWRNSRLTDGQILHSLSPTRSAKWAALKKCHSVISQRSDTEIFLPQVANIFITTQRGDGSLSTENILALSSVPSLCPLIRFSICTNHLYELVLVLQIYFRYSDAGLN